ncbi:MAG TPA: hypothetical protein PK823_15605, partial [Novosphingobium sp.]|nr:hypothetical protein [Novosphingobium sp.]
HHQVSWSQFLNRAGMISARVLRLPKDSDRDHEDRQSVPTANIPNIPLHHKAQFGDELVSMHSIYFEYDINIPHVLPRDQVVV